MKKSILVPALLITCLGIYAQNPNPSAAIDSEITAIMGQQHFAGTSTVIVKGGEIVWLQSYGFANSDLGTPFTDTTSLMLASVSKIFTGTTIMQLYDDGLINLDDNINAYLPFEINIPGFENTPITFKMLLTHTSSIKDNWEAMDGYYNDNGDPTISLADCMERYFSTTGADYSAGNNFLDKQPGTVHEYSNIATALEGYLVEVISGMPFNEYCQQNIFDQLCMDNTHWFLSEYPNINTIASPHDYFNSQYEPVPHYGFADYPDGMLRSNSKDLANYMIAVLQGGTFANGSFISANVLDEMFTPQIPGIEPEQGYQFFNYISGNISLWGHEGGEQGISTQLYFDFNNDMGIAILANGENDGSEIFDVLYEYGIGLSPSGIGAPPCSHIVSTIDKAAN